MMKKERFEAFTDAVIAIIITILVLEVRLPDDNHSLNALADIGSQFLAYILSFVMIAALWVNHHYTFSKVKYVDNKILYINILLLFWTSLIPATTAWMGSDIFAVVPAELYIVNVILFNLTNAWLRRVVIEKNDIAELSQLNRVEIISMVINFTTLVAAFFYPPLLFIGLGCDFTLWFIPRVNHAH